MKIDMSRVAGGLDAVPVGTVVHVDPTDGGAPYHAVVVAADRGESLVDAYRVTPVSSPTAVLRVETHWIRTYAPNIGDVVRHRSGFEAIVTEVEGSVYGQRQLTLAGLRARFWDSDQLTVVDRRYRREESGAAQREMATDWS